MVVKNIDYIPEVVAEINEDNYDDDDDEGNLFLTFSNIFHWSVKIFQ